MLSCKGLCFTYDGHGVWTDKKERKHSSIYHIPCSNIFGLEIDRMGVLIFFALRCGVLPVGCGWSYGRDNT